MRVHVIRLHGEWWSCLLGFRWYQGYDMPSPWGPWKMPGYLTLTVGPLLFTVHPFGW